MMRQTDQHLSHMWVTVAWVEVDDTRQIKEHRAVLPISDMQFETALLATAPGRAYTKNTTRRGGQNTKCTHTHALARRQLCQPLTC